MPFANLKNLKLYYETQGKGQRVLFITGTASDLRQKLNIFKSPLVENFEILSLDQRGIGQSNSPDLNPTMQDYAKDIKKLLDHMGWKNCHVMGESFGGMVAQEFAIQYPKYVNKLVLVVTSSGGKGGSSFPYHKYDMSKMNLKERAEFFVSCCDTRTKNSQWKKKNKKLFQAQYENYLEVFNWGSLNPEKSVYSQRQIKARKGHNTFARLSKLKMPVLICAGRFDNTAPLKNQLALLANISNARLNVYEGSHMVLWQDPLVFRNIQDFLKI